MGVRVLRVAIFALALTLGACDAEQAVPSTDASPTSTTSVPPTSVTSTTVPTTTTTLATTTSLATTTTTEPPSHPLAWVAVEDAGEVALVDLEDGSVLDRRQVGPGPHNLTVAPDGTMAVCLYGGDAIAIVRGDETITVELGGRPHDVKPARTGFAVANEAARRIDLVGFDGSVTGAIALDARPHDLAVTGDGTEAWVTLDASDRLARVDLVAGEVIGYVSTGERPHDIRIAGDGRIFVTDWRGPLHVLDSSGVLQETIELGEEAHHVAFTPDGSTLWLVDHELEEVFVVDAVDLEVVGRAPVPGAPHHVAISPGGRLAAVADHDNGTVVVYDTGTLEAVRTVEVGPGPHGVWETMEPSG